jgi:hypothetical protein
MPAAIRAKISAASTGHVVTQATRDKISAANAGQVPPNKGVPMTPQQLANNKRSRRQHLRAVVVVAELSEQVAKLTRQLTKVEQRLSVGEKWVALDND